MERAVNIHLILVLMLVQKMFFWSHLESYCGSQKFNTSKSFFILFYFGSLSVQTAGIWWCTSSVTNCTFKSFTWVPRNARKLSILPGAKCFCLTQVCKQCLNYIYNIRHISARYQAKFQMCRLDIRNCLIQTSLKAYRPRNVQFLSHKIWI